MNKKQLVNQLNSQKGITGGDVVIAILIILTTIGVIGTVYANLVIGSKETDRKTGATRIATNILENIDMIYFDEIEQNLKTLSDSGDATYGNNTYYISENNNVFNTKIPSGYNAEISLENPFEDYNYLRKITVKVKYKVDGRDRNVTLSKLVEREIIRECNSPNFTDDYIRQIIPNGTFEIYSNNSVNAQTGVKIICPIQYDKDSKKYKIVEKTDGIWYSYSNKQWARILVLDANELQSYIDSTTKTVKNVDVLKSDDSYVWIPRFGVKNGGDTFGDTLFKYKNTDNAIKNSYLNSNDVMIYYTLELENQINWANRGITFETKDKLGIWSKYSDISTLNTDAYNLNQSQYGPMVEY